MRLLAMLREAWATTWAAKIPSALIAVVTAAMCFGALATIGQSAAAAAEVNARMEQAGARLLSVVDGKTEGFINDHTLDAVAGLSTVDSAHAFGTPIDVTNGAVGPGGTAIALWPVLGSMDGSVTLIDGRWPTNPGEAIVARDQLAALGMTRGVGYLSGRNSQQFAVVGTFTAAPPFDDLNAGAIAIAADGEPGRELRVIIDSIESARVTVGTTLDILDPQQTDGVYLESPTSIAQTARDLNAQLANHGRTQLLMILAVGGFFVAAVVLADVLIRRRDLGRRRTLGITRADLTAVVALRASITGLIGAVLGCTAGWILNHNNGTTTPLDYTIAVGILAVLTAGMMALPPAIYAAHRDPVRVMRTA